MSTADRKVYRVRDGKESSEPVFVNVYGAQESIPPACVAWRAGTTIWVVIPARPAGIDSWAP
jgi:hypothetical protein